MLVINTACFSRGIQANLPLSKQYICTKLLLQEVIQKTKTKTEGVQVRLRVGFGVIRRSNDVTHIVHGRKAMPCEIHRGIIGKMPSSTTEKIEFSNEIDHFSAIC